MADPARFPCYLAEKDAAGEVRAQVAEKSLDDLPPGNVLIRVAYSSLNYKDALSASGHPGVTRQFPHVPGIDAAGTVAESDAEHLRPGDEVLVTGYGLGMNHWGGFAGYVRVPAEWVVRLPEGLELRESMIYGTAGFTAGLAVDALQQQGIVPGQGEVVVTGASGGVGSLAVAILSRCGYRVAAVTGKPEAADWLRQLGADTLLDRGEVDDRSGKPLLPARWSAAIDTVGGNTLSTLVRSVDRRGCVAACGLVGGAEFQLTVYPFLLRGLVLAGIDSAECPREQREAIWRQLAGPWRPQRLEAIAEEVGLSQLGERITCILAGRIRGRVLVRPWS